MGIEIKINNVNYFFSLEGIENKDDLKQKIKDLLSVPDEFDKTKFNELKKLIGTEF